MTIAATDSEYISENAAPGYNPGQRPDVMETYCELIQLGASRLDDAGVEVAVQNRLVRAHQIEVIPPWLSRMTGITAERREDEGVHFSEALEELVALARSERPWCFSGDSSVLAWNCAVHGIPFPFQRPFWRVKPRLEEWGVSWVDYQALGYHEINSGHLHEVLGIELPAISGVGAHDALHDARSIAHSLHYLLHNEHVLALQ